jgi:hypothetical protein
MYIYILLRRYALGQGSPVPLKLLYRKNPAREPGEKTCNYPLESRNKNPKYYKRKGKRVARLVLA